MNRRQFQVVPHVQFSSTLLPRATPAAARAWAILLGLLAFWSVNARAAEYGVVKWPLTIYHGCPDDPLGDCDIGHGPAIMTIVGKGTLELDFDPLWAEVNPWADAWYAWEECIDLYGDGATCEDMGLYEPENDLEVTARVISATLSMFGHTFTTGDFEYGYQFDWSYRQSSPDRAWLTVGKANNVGDVQDPGLFWNARDEWAFWYNVKGNMGSFEYPSGNADLYFNAPAFDLKLKAKQVAGCKSVTGTVTLPQPAPAGGRSFSLSDTLISAIAPSTVTIPEGTTTKSFSVKTEPVSILEAGRVSATLSFSNGSSVTGYADLAVRPMGVSSVSVAPNPVVGGKPAVGTVRLECDAGPGPITVSLGSGNTAVANPVSPTVVVPQAMQSAKFDITTNPVLEQKGPTISASVNGSTKVKTLKVLPAAAVSPTSVKFGSVSVGATSSSLNATLTNKGAVAFSVNSISLTGTASNWFAQTNNCPASLPAGDSCMISVRFTPQAAASKSAKLTIATSATSAPLSVSLSGTGI
jgi:hypothetical protein